MTHEGQSPELSLTPVVEHTSTIAPLTSLAPMRLVPVFLLLCLPATAAAQGTCTPDRDSHEADMMARYSVPMAFSPLRAPWVYPLGAVGIGLELSSIPNVSSTIATPTACRPGNPPLNTDFGEAFPRPRLIFGLAQGAALEVSWTPPVTRIHDVRPNLWGLALSRSVQLGPRTYFSGRLHATLGSVRAPVICDDPGIDLPDPNACILSRGTDDTFKPNIFGVELMLGWSAARGGVRPYLGAGYNILHPRFEGRFRDNLGQPVVQKVEVNLSRVVAFGGITLAPIRGLELSGEAYAAPSDALTGRIRLSWFPRT